MDEIKGWFRGALPQEWQEEPVEVVADREEILVTIALADVDPSDLSEEGVESAREARIDRWRGDTKGRRISVARDAEARFGRKVAWAARCGEQRKTFTSLGVPVMTRLRISERRVLDTLVEAGVARSRSHALAWCVHLVGKNEEGWISELRDALVQVEKARAGGPSSAA